MFKSSLYLSNYQCNFVKSRTQDTSTLSKRFSMMNPLIAMIGISEYDKNVNYSLERVIDDYKNVEHAFHNIRGYSFVYFNKNNNVVHKIDQNQKKKMKTAHGQVTTTQVTSSNNAKLRWNENEIFDYNDKIHNILNSKKYNYDGLIYFISCHGNTGSIIYDSNGNKVPLIAIYDKFNNQNCISLRNKPKIYFIEACRGNRKTKRYENSIQSFNDNTDAERGSSIVTTAPKLIGGDISHDSQLGFLAPQQFPIKIALSSIDEVKQIEMHDSTHFNNSTLVSTSNGQSQKSKNNSNVMFSKYNYNREIYANTDGFAVVEPGKNGAYMTRSITQAILNDDIFKKDFNTIMNHVRKIMLKLMGTSAECAAQVIEDHNNIPRRVFFK